MKIFRSPRSHAAPTSPPPGELRASEWRGPLTDRETLLHAPDTAELSEERAMRGIPRPEERDR